MDEARKKEYVKDCDDDYIGHHKHTPYHKRIAEWGQPYRIKWAKQFVRLGGTVLNVGGGDGVTTYWLLQGDLKPTTVDCSPAVVKEFKNNLPNEKVILSLVEELDKNVKEQYDLVLCNQVLEHVDEPRVAIKQLWDRVKPGGVLVTSFPIGLEIVDRMHQHTWDDFYQVMNLFDSVVDCKYKIHTIPKSKEQDRCKLWSVVCYKEKEDGK